MRSRDPGKILLARMCAALSMAIGVLSLIGWIAGYPTLSSGIPGLQPMVVNTAVAIVLLGAAVFFISARMQRAAAILGALIAAVGAASTFEYATGIRLGLEDVLFRHQSSGQMAWLTGILLIAVGAGVACEAMEIARRTAVALITVTGVVALFVLLGYLYGISAYYEIARNKPIALNTALALLLICLSLLVCSSRRNWMHIYFLRGSAAATLARRITFALLGVTVLSGLARTAATTYGLLDGNAGLALLVVVNVTLCLALILMQTDLLHAHELGEREAQAAVRLSDERFRLAAKAIDALVYDWNMVDNTIWRSDGTRVFGYDASEPSLEWWAEKLHPEERDALVGDLMRVTESPADRWGGEYRLRRADHSYAIVSERGYVIRDAAGKPLRMIGAITDVTSLKRAEELLRDSKAELERRVDERTLELRQTNEWLSAAIEARDRIEQQLERERDFSNTVVATAGALILVIDRERRIVRFNSACERVTGYREEEVRGRAFDEILLIEEERPAVNVTWSELLAKPASTRYENHLRTRAGELRLIEWRNTSIDNAGGVPLFVVAAGIDVTEQRRAQHELEQQRDQLEQLTRELRTSNAELEAFSYSVSHDLRAPLRALDGFSQALLEDNAPQLDDRGRRYLDRISAAATRMGHLIDDLLTLSRVSRTQMRDETVNLSAIAREIAARLQQETPERVVQLDIDDGLLVHGDPRLLGVALENLLSNAWKFTSRSPEARIHVGGRAENGTMRVFVRDNGAGFDMQFADKLFAPFQRLHHARDYPGNGVGLATVQRIIRRHGGHVFAEAVPQQGATFSFDIPDQRRAA